MNKKLLVALVLLGILGGTLFVMYKEGDIPLPEEFEEEGLESEISEEEDEQEQEQEARIEPTLRPAKKAHIVTPAVSEDEKGQAIERVIEASNIAEEIQMMDEMLEAQLEQFVNSMDLNHEELEKVEKLRSLMSGESILSEYKKELYEKLSADEIKELAKIYDDPLMSEMSERDRVLRSPSGQQDLMDYWRKFDTKNFSKERLDLIDAHDTKSGLSKRAAEMIRNLAKSMPRESRDIDPDEFFDEEFERNIRNSNRIAIAKKTENLTVEELGKYNSLVGSKAMQKSEDIKAAVIGRNIGKAGKVTSDIRHKASSKDE